MYSVHTGPQKINAEPGTAEYSQVQPGTYSARAAKLAALSRDPANHEKLSMNAYL